MVGPARRADLAVPATMPVANLMPLLVRHTTDLCRGPRRRRARRVVGAAAARPGAVRAVRHAGEPGLAGGRGAAPAPGRGPAARTGLRRPGRGRRHGGQPAGRPVAAGVPPGAVPGALSGGDGPDRRRAGRPGPGAAPGDRRRRARGRPASPRRWSARASRPTAPFPLLFGGGAAFFAAVAASSAVDGDPDGVAWTAAAGAGRGRRDRRGDRGPAGRAAYGHAGHAVRPAADRRADRRDGGARAAGPRRLRSSPRRQVSGGRRVGDPGADRGRAPGGGEAGPAARAAAAQDRRGHVVRHRAGGLRPGQGARRRGGHLPDRLHDRVARWSCRCCCTTPCGRRAGPGGRWCS